MKLLLKGFTEFSGFYMGTIDGEIGITKEVNFDNFLWLNEPIYCGRCSLSALQPASIFNGEQQDIPAFA